MYSIMLIAGMAALLAALLGGLVVIVIPRAVRQTAASIPSPPVLPFEEEFIGELARLDEAVAVIPETKPEDSFIAADDVYALHRSGEPAFRIASRLGIGKADAELLIRIAGTARGNSERGSGDV